MEPKHRAAHRDSLIARRDLGEARIAVGVERDPDQWRDVDAINAVIVAAGEGRRVPHSEIAEAEAALARLRKAAGIRSASELGRER